MFDPAGEYPRLRARFESSKLLVAQACKRAALASERARIIRSLLEARQEQKAESQSVESTIWATAASKEPVRASRERDEALGVLSHELRQSLSAAIAAERVLLITNDPAKSSKAWDVLERQLVHLAKLLDDVLDFSRLSLRTGGGIAREQIDLRSVLMTAVEGTEATYAAQGQRLTVSLSPEPQIVRADATKLLQVFSNLLQNASRYTPSGGSVTLCSMTNGECARVTLEDTGVGISPEAQHTIFEPFVRGTSEGGGLGVGLALARRIIELHEGIITVRSDGDGLGSTFTVVLPLDVREQDDAQHTNS